MCKVCKNIHLLIDQLMDNKEIAWMTPHLLLFLSFKATLHLLYIEAILRVNLLGVWYPDKSISLESDTLTSHSGWSLITWQVNNLGVWYPGDSITLGSDTLGESISLESDTLAIQSPWSLIPWRVNLLGVGYPGKSISPKSATLAVFLKLKVWITWQKSLIKSKTLNSMVSAKEDLKYDIKKLAVLSL